MNEARDFQGNPVKEDNIVIAIQGDYKTLEYARVIKITKGKQIRLLFQHPNMSNRLKEKLCSQDQVILVDPQEATALRLAGTIEHLYTKEPI